MPVLGVQRLSFLYFTRKRLIKTNRKLKIFMQETRVSDSAARHTLYSKNSNTTLDETISNKERSFEVYFFIDGDLTHSYFGNSAITILELTRTTSLTSLITEMSVEDTYMFKK
jgi:hypothetical protein